MLIQLHWQFKDGSTDGRAQRDINPVTHNAIAEFFEEIKDDHPLPEGAQWMVCNEESEHFVYMKADE